MRFLLILTAGLFSVLQAEDSKNEKEVAQIGVGVGVDVDGGYDDGYNDGYYYEDQGPVIWVGPGWYGGVWYDNEGDWDHGRRNRDGEHRGDGGRGGRGGEGRGGGGGRSGGHGGRH